MSGTSADGVDAALVEWPEGVRERPLRLLAFRAGSVSDGAAAADPRSRGGPGGRPRDALAELAGLDVELGERFAASAAALAQDAGVALAEIDAIASHGQTVAHHPARHATLQIGDPSVIAERTGCTTVADFRPRDLALGGEGAPLAPFFHHAAFADPAEARVVLNLGGIANVTWLPPGGRAEDVIAFDVGPANALIDGVVRTLANGRERFDRDGARAARGRVDPALLARLLDDDFLRRAAAEVDRTRALRAGRGRGARPRVDAGRAARRTTWSRRWWPSASRRSGARVATSSGGRALERLLVGGGGAENPVVMAALARALAPARVEPMDAAGVPARACEAMAFALLGRNALLGRPNHLPRCTGAQPGRRARRDRSGKGGRAGDRSEPDRETVVRGLEVALAAAGAHLRAEVREHHAPAVELGLVGHQRLVVQVELEARRRDRCTRRRRDRRRATRRGSSSNQPVSPE